MNAASESSPLLPASAGDGPRSAATRWEKRGVVEKAMRSPKTPVKPKPQAQQPRLQAIAAAFEDPEEQPIGGPRFPAMPRAYDAGAVRPCCVLLYLATFFFAATLCYAIVALTQSFACLGPPYLYVTNKGSKNIMKYSRDGCLIHEKVLWGVNNQRADLRSMTFGSYHGEEVLYVADTSANQSGVMVFGSCFQSTSLRTFVTRAVAMNRNPGAVHTYGVAVDESGDLYASFQDSGAVLRFEAETFRAMPLPVNVSRLLLTKSKATVPSDTPTLPVPLSSTLDPSLSPSASPSLTTEGKKQKKKHGTDPVPSGRRLEGHKPKHDQGDVEAASFFDGTFVQFGAHGKDDSALRSLVWVRNYTELWIADEAVDAIAIVDRQGRLLDTIAVTNPIGLHYPGSGGYAANNLTGLPSSNIAQSPVVYVSSKANKKQNGAVYAVDVVSRQVVRSYHSLGMKHPAGVTSHHDLLFVADQTRNAIIAFNVTTTRVVKVIVPKQKMEGPIEQIVMSPC